MPQLLLTKARREATQASLDSQAAEVQMKADTAVRASLETDALKSSLASQKSAAEAETENVKLEAAKAVAEVEKKKAET